MATTTNKAALQIATESILALIQATSNDKNYNAQNLAIDALKIARSVIKEHPATFIPGEPNSKTGIKSIDLLPFVTCHKRCRNTCGAIRKGCKYNIGKCYAYKLMYRNPATCARYAINTALLIDNPSVFWAGVEQLIIGERFIRVFVAGDANIPGFIENICNLLNKYPHCIIQGFSKCYEQVNEYIAKYGKLPDNFKLLLSGWQDMKPDNPHNLPISDVYDDALPEGWLSCGGNCFNCACVGLGCWKATAGDIVGLKKH